MRAFLSNLAATIADHAPDAIAETLRLLASAAIFAGIMFVCIACERQPPHSSFVCNHAEHGVALARAK